ncbi:hypothetical protein pb186bvf_016625 [Paramecium bursaria]
MMKTSEMNRSRLRKTELVIQEGINYQEYYQIRFEEQIIYFSLNPNNYQLAISFEQNKKIKFFNTHKRKYMKQLRFIQTKGENQITQIQYSFNNKLLYLIDNPGKIIILRNDRICKKVNSIKINDEEILCLKQMDSRQIITAHLRGYILITDIVLKQQLIQIFSFQYYIEQLEFDNINNIIISQAGDKSIMFFSLNGEKIIDQQHAHQYGLLRIFLTRENNLISVSIDDIKLWKIDYLNKCLIQLKCLENLDSLQYLIQSVDKTKLILIDKNHIKVIDHNLGLELDHVLPETKWKMLDQFIEKSIMIYLFQIILYCFKYLFKGAQIVLFSNALEFRQFFIFINAEISRFFLALLNTSCLFYF